MSNLKESCRNLEEDRDQLEGSMLRFEEETKLLKKKSSLSSGHVHELEANLDQLRDQFQKGEEEVSTHRSFFFLGKGVKS